MQSGMTKVGTARKSIRRIKDSDSNWVTGGCSTCSIPLLEKHPWLLPNTKSLWFSFRQSVILFSERRREITKEERFGVVKQLNGEKAPGPDGGLFFRHFFSCSKSGKMRVPSSYPKNSSESFRDYRPISLCNVFLQIISKILANRFKEFFLTW